jgi:uncharacterized alpha/beta hydrolase family protein
MMNKKLMEDMNKMMQTIGFNQFVDAFHNMNRKENFSYDGLRALFDYLEEYEESTRKPYELDVIALCCEYTEYENLEAYLKECNPAVERKDYDTDEEYKEALEEYITHHTQIIKLSGDIDEGFIIQVY